MKLCTVQTCLRRRPRRTRLVGRGSAGGAAARDAGAVVRRCGGRDRPVRVGRRGRQCDRARGGGGAGHVLLPLPDQGARAGRVGASRRGQDRGQARHDERLRPAIWLRCWRCWCARCSPRSGGWVRWSFGTCWGCTSRRPGPSRTNWREHPLAEFVIAAITEAQAAGRVPQDADAGELGVIFMTGLFALLATQRPASAERGSRCWTGM